MTNINFEFLPTQTAAGTKKLLRVRDRFAQENPEFFSATYGAGVSTRGRTRSIQSLVKKSYPI
jgi:methylenetetrahydrofolate reductase (NADPH)